MNIPVRTIAVLLRWQLLATALLATVASFAYTDPFQTSGTFTNATFFSRIDLDLPGLSEVKSAVLASDYDCAKRKLFAYYATRFPLGSTPPVAFQPIPAEASADVSDLLAHRFTFYGEQLDIDDSNGSPVWIDATLASMFAAAQASDPTPVPFPAQWDILLIRFGFVPTVIANFNHEQTQSGGNGAHLINMIALTHDYICDTVTTPGISHGGGLQVASRTNNLITSFPYLLAEDTEVDRDRLTVLLKYLVLAADWLHDPANFLGAENNRGLAQAAALKKVALYFPEFALSPAAGIPTASEWESQADDWTEQYLQANIHENGALAEPTTHYHAGQVASLFKTWKFGADNNSPSLPNGTRLLNRMLTYYGDTSFWNGQLAMIGDTSATANFDDRLSIADFFARSDLVYHMTQGGSAPGGITGVEPKRTSKLYGHGLAVMRRAWGANGPVAIIENQPAGNHSHPDNLSINLFAYGDQLLMNSGRVAGYDDRNPLVQWHSDETRANSTVEIDGRPMRSFGEKVNQWVSQAGFDFFDGQYHDAPTPRLRPTDDVYLGYADVETGDPLTEIVDDNYGTSTVLKVFNEVNGKNDAMSYLRFRPGLISAQIQDVTLTVYQSNSATNTVEVYGIRRPGSLDLRDDWNQFNLDWIPGNDIERARFRIADDAAIDTTDTTNVVNLGNFEFVGENKYTLGSTLLRDFVAAETAGGKSGIIELVLVDMNTGSGSQVELSSSERSRESQNAGNASNTPLTLDITLASGGPTSVWDDVITHRRKVFYDRGDVFVVTDRLTGGVRSHRYDQLWSLNPDTPTNAPWISTNGVAQAQVNSGPWIHVATADLTGETGLPATAATAALDDGWVSKAAASAANKRVRFRKEDTGTVTFDTVLVPSSASLNVIVSRLATGTSRDVATALSITGFDATSDALNYYLTHQTPVARTFGQFQTDGEVAMIRTGSGGTVIKTVALRNATWLKNGTGTNAPYIINATDRIADLFVDFTDPSAIWVYAENTFPTRVEVYPQGNNSNVPVYLNNEPMVDTLFTSGGYYALRRKVLLDARFENGVTDDWTGAGTTWVVESISGNHVLAHHSLAHNESVISGKIGWNNYTLEADVQIDEVSPTATAVGLIARDTGSDYYAFVYNPDAFRFEIRRGANVLAYSAAEHLPAGVTYHFKAKVNGSALTLYVDHEEKVTVSDASLSNGKVGLVTHGCDVSFDRVVVTALYDSAQNLGIFAASSNVNQELIASGNSSAADRFTHTNVFTHFMPPYKAMLAVRDDASSTIKNSRVSLVKFDLSTYVGSVVNGVSDVQSAKLRLYGFREKYFAYPDTEKVPVKVYVISNTWNDAQLAWDNVPAHSSGDYIGTILVHTPQWHELDVTAEVAAAFSAGQISFKLIDDQGTDRTALFYSTVYALKPRLILKNY